MSAVPAMLRSFQVANHRSIRDEQELTLLPAYDQSRPVVPVAAVFGANASGKSNLLDAFRWMRSAVIGSYRLWEAESGVPRQPFRLDPAMSGAPSSFAVDLLIDGVAHVYGFSVEDEVIAEEWLLSYPHNRERIIFRRDRQSVELGSTLPERRGRADLLSGLLRRNALLLSTAVQANQDEFLPVYRWFRQCMRLSGRQTGPWENEALVADVAYAVAEFPFFLDLLRAADLGIAGVRVVNAPPPFAVYELATGSGKTEHFRATIDAHGPASWAPVEVPPRHLQFLHGDSGVPLRWSDQSEGTRAWVQLLVAALAALRQGALFMVDEVDASLHPRLTARLIELFRAESTNPSGAQLLFTTHDATLLGTNLDGEVLARDEIWFIEKRDGASQLYPLSDFHPRKGENRERRYLAGSYGAVPVTFADSLVESMLATRAEPPDAEA